MASRNTTYDLVVEEELGWASRFSFERGTR